MYPFILDIAEDIESVVLLFLFASQITGGWSGQEAAVFDVTVLEGTAVGRTLLREQLCPLLEDKNSTKVTYGYHSLIGPLSAYKYFGRIG